MSENLQLIFSQLCLHYNGFLFCSTTFSVFTTYTPIWKSVWHAIIHMPAITPIGSKSHTISCAPIDTVQLLQYFLIGRIMALSHATISPIWYQISLNQTPNLISHKILSSHTQTTLFPKISSQITHKLYHSTSLHFTVSN